MASIKQVIPVLPISLVAMVMRQSGDQGLSAFEVEAHVNQLIEKLQDDEVPVYIASRSRVQTILDGLNMLKLRHLVVESDGIYKVVPEEYDVLSYYANSIVHWLKDS
jgi:glycerol-3-phosphate O-acyltransferase